MQNQCVLCEIPTQMLFTSMVTMETTSCVTFYILRQKVLKVSNNFTGCDLNGTQNTNTKQAKSNHDFSEERAWGEIGFFMPTHLP